MEKSIFVNPRFASSVKLEIEAVFSRRIFIIFFQNEKDYFGNSLSVKTALIYHNSTGDSTCSNFKWSGKEWRKKVCRIYILFVSQHFFLLSVIGWRNVSKRRHICTEIFMLGIEKSFVKCAIKIIFQWKSTQISHDHSDRNPIGEIYGRKMK